MHRRMHSPRIRRTLGVWVLLLPVVLAACATGATAASAPSPAPTATATPAGALFHTITLPHFQATQVMPMAHGLALIGAPDGQPLPNDPDIGPPALYYYDFATRNIQTLVTAGTAADGSQNGIDASCMDDWCVYTIQSSMDSGNAPPSQLLALNVVSHAQRTLTPGGASGSVDTSAGTRTSTSDQTSDDGYTFGFTFHIYNLADGSDTTVHFSAPHYENSAVFLYPVALDRSVMAFGEFHANTADPDADGVYLSVNGATPRRISPDDAKVIAVSSRYVVWDSSSPEQLALYDIATGHLLDPWVFGCIRPALAQDRPYVACVDFAHNTMRLVQVPSGKSITFGRTLNQDDATIAGDRVYWIQPDASGSATSSSTIGYFDLPA